MEKFGHKRPFSGGPNSWLREELYLKIHLELTLLAVQQILSWEDSEEIAGECLSALWIEYERTGFPYPIKPFLLGRMKDLIQQYQQSLEIRRTVETFYLFFNQINIRSEENRQQRISLLYDVLLPVLEIEERAVLESLLLYGMDLPAIALMLDYPLSKVRKHYKHGIFRLQKFLGLWKKIR